MRLIHLSDPHLSTLAGQTFWRLRGKRRSGYLSWRRRRRHVHLGTVLGHLTDAVHGEAACAGGAAHIVLTGDLVHVGLREEIEAAGVWLRQLGAPDRVTLVPGNHDLYAADCWPVLRECWGDYLPAVADGEAGTGFPSSRRVGADSGAVTVLGLSSARPSPLFMAHGALGAAQLQRLDGALGGAQGFRCVAVHHPPFAGQTHWRKALKDAAALGAMLRRHRAELVLHGHVHRNHGFHDPSGVAVYGTASASSADVRAPASYRVFDIDRGDPAADRWHVRMRLMCVHHDGPAAGVATTAATADWTSPIRRSASDHADPR